MIITTDSTRNQNCIQNARQDTTLLFWTRLTYHFILRFHNGLNFNGQWTPNRDWNCWI